MHIPLPDRQCCQLFLSTSFSFRSKFSKFVYVKFFSCYSLFLFFIRQQVTQYNYQLEFHYSLQLLISFRVTDPVKLHLFCQQNFICLQVLLKILITFLFKVLSGRQVGRQVASRMRCSISSMVTDFRFVLLFYLICR